MKVVSLEPGDSFKTIYVGKTTVRIRIARHSGITVK